MIVQASRRVMRGLVVAMFLAGAMTVMQLPVRACDWHWYVQTYGETFAYVAWYFDGCVGTGGQ